MEVCTVSEPAPNRTALLLGATGLVGGHCLELLLGNARYGRVRVLGRRPVRREHPKLEQQVIDFDRPDPAAVSGADDVFCCLGSTLGNAGSPEAFRTVELQYPVRIGRLAVEHGAEQYLVVSAVSADPESRILYVRVKGEMEQAVAELPFRSVTFVRPSLLLGDRDEFRLGERIGEWVMRPLSPLMLGPLRKYRPVPARAVAAAMVRLAAEPRPGVRVVESDEIERVAGR